MAYSHSFAINFIFFLYDIILDRVIIKSAIFARDSSFVENDDNNLLTTSTLLLSEERRERKAMLCH